MLQCCLPNRRFWDVYLPGQLAHANVEVTFVESAPKDRFILTQYRQGRLNDLTVHLDLSNSVGRLIFEYHSNRAGVEVFPTLSK